MKISIVAFDDFTDLDLFILWGAEIAPGVPYQIFNESEREVEFLVVSQPPSHGDRFSAN